MINKVYLVGAGPGRPDLITLRGLNILKEADVVIYDYLLDKGLFKYIKKGAELIGCDKLAKKGRHSDGSLIHQEKIHELLIKKARQAKKVVRLKNGDPSIFSRCSQELEALYQAGIEFEVVPGVTAASAASAFSGIPLTDRKIASSCVFVTGHQDPTKSKSLIDWNSIAKRETIVLYMAVENLKEIASQLIGAGKERNTPVAIVQEISFFSQKVLKATLKDIALKAEKYEVRPPAIIIVGEVVNFEEKFNWLKNSKRVLFTGLSQERFFTKGFYFHLPLIKIIPLKSYKKFDTYLRKIDEFDWIVFSSRYGVEYFFQRLQAIGRDARVLKGIKIAAIGGSTKKRLLDYGIKADLVPQQESSGGLLKRFKKENLKNKKIFLPRSDLSDKNLEKGFQKLGVKVISSFAYKNVMPDDLPDLNLNNFTEIKFSSPSAVRNFKRRYKKVPKGVKVSCIGQVTLKEAKRCRLLG